ncbi:SCP2 sterol-binding domain-containing protein [Spirillospora sp. CA-294931]|uniref:SCP2 sterol-binding domain-containing protein n=1 Tax=Spirillospora sp. CA-294931 TaxID=3240042 RepID=UPI003D95095B
MPKYLTPEWMAHVVEAADGLPERSGSTAVLQYVLTETPDGEDVHYHWVLENGRLTEVAQGLREGADFTVTMTYADSVLIEKGELSDDDAYAQGRTKFSGSMVKAMRLTPLLNSPEFKAVQDKIRAGTEF